MNTSTQTKETEKERQLKDARCALDSVLEMVDELERGRINDPDTDTYDDALQRINEDPLSVQVGISGFFNIGATPDPDEFEILLGTGGPAYRIIGDLDEHDQPVKCRFQWQDWFIPWTDVEMNEDESDKVQDYCNCFYFGS